MRLATIKLNNEEIAGIVTENGVLPIRELNAATGSEWEETLLPLIEADQVRPLTDWYNNGGKEQLADIPGGVPKEEVVYAPLYRDPPHIFGIGLNYVDHAGDIGAASLARTALRWRH